MKILHLPTSTGGNSYGLSRAERGIGLESDVLTINNNYFDYPQDIMVDLSGNRISKYLKLFKCFMKINGKYDVYHFNYGESLFSIPKLNLNFIDLHFYNNKSKFVVTYNGSDCRQFLIGDCCNGIRESVERDYKKQQRVDKMDKYCKTIFYLNPDLKRFLPSRSIFLPYSIATWNNITHTNRKYRFPLKIVHAPSSRNLKGTSDIINIIDNINLNYPGKTEFIIVEGMKNSDAIKIYEQADILIDQIVIGWYGALSVEAMKAGCAVMVYIREDDLKFIPDSMHADIKKTFINSNKYNLYENIAKIIDNTNLLYTYSKYSYEFVNTWHNPDYVASITKAAYE